MNDRARQQLIIWWMLWASFQTGVFVTYYYLSVKQGAAPATQNSTLWLVGLVPLALSGFIRWSIMNLLANAQTALTFFILGMALAEICCFLGLFIFPSQRLELFLMSVFGIFQFVPVFAKRFYG